MAHRHSVYDTNLHFVIDPVTRLITNQVSSKTTLIQGDHNSERLTFELPSVDGHDMTQCDSIQVHFINISATDKTLTSSDVYTVDDVKLKPDSENTVTFSWLVSGNATKYAGLLSFVIRFICLNGEGEVSYVWQTGIYSNITVGEGLNFSESALEEYSDVIAMWDYNYSFVKATLNYQGQIMAKREELTEGLNTKVDKTTEASKIYGTNGKGEGVLYTVADNPVGGAIPRYNYNAGSKYTLRTADAVTELDCVNKRSFERVVNPLEERVSELESLTLSYPEITSTDYEKIVPAEAGKYALVKMIGGATEAVYGANTFDPKFFILYSVDESPVEYTVDEKGLISFTLYYDRGDLMARSEITLLDGEYSILIESNGNIRKNIQQVDSNATRIELEFPLPEGAEYGDNWYASEYTYNVKIMVTKIRSQVGYISVSEAPAGTVFEPYVEPYFVNADVERIESLSKNRLPNDVYDVRKWTKNAEDNFYSYYLDFLDDGWYCLSAKLKEGYKNNIYFYLQKSVDGGITYETNKSAYRGDGYVTNGHYISNTGIASTAPFWFKVDKRAGIVYRLVFNAITQEKLDMIYDIQIERANLTQEPSNPSYKPSVYAPVTEYTPYSAEPIDTITIPEAVRSKEGYGRGGSYIEWVIKEDEEVIITLTVTKDENLEPLTPPIVTDITNLFTVDNAIEVQGGGVLRFVTKKEIAVPSTVGYVTRKG